MLTVLHTESSKGWGGQENRTLKESIGLKNLGARVIILCQPGSILEKKAKEEGIEVRTCKMNKSYDLRAVKYMLKLIKDEKVDIINTHSGKDSFLAGIAGKLSRKKPAVVRTRHLALPITSKFTYKYLCDKIVTVSEYVREYLISESISPEKIVAIPTGIELEKFNPDKVSSNLKQQLGISAENPLVGTVSILRKKKGHHILLDAIPLILKKIPECVFVIVGDGPQKENILAKIKSMNLTDKVFLLGLREDISQIIKSIDLFVLPTLQEALGTAFLEAMAMKKTVIGTNVDGVKEVIKDGINGHLVEPNNPSQLAEAVVKILKNPQKSIEMGIQGRKIVEEKYTVEKMCKSMYELYLSLVENKAK